MSLYHYLLLHEFSSDIRLVRLHPAEKLDDPLVCQLSVVSLETKPNYDALSYTWGDPVFDHHLTCNNQRLRVTGNLYRALLRLRRTTSRTIWVDQICIDQGNTRERNLQVNLMTKIFAIATSVFVDLGTMDEAAQEALSFSSRMYHFCDKIEEATDATELPAWIAERSVRQWTAWLNLFRCAWWSRVWVIQEAFCSKNHHVLCENHEVDWDSLLRSFMTVSSLLQRGALPPAVTTALDDDIVSMSRRMYGWLELFHAHRFSNLYQRNPLRLCLLLDSFRDSRSTDPRDKIYSLVGVPGIDDSIRATIPQPDYNLPVHIVYCQFALWFCNRGLLFSILTMAGIHNRSTEGLPSWVPDWSRKRSCYSFGNAFFNTGFCAGGEDASRWESIPGSQCLSVSGAMIDAITDLGPVLPTGSQEGNESNSYPSDEDFIFWNSASKTLIKKYTIHKQTSFEASFADSVHRTTKSSSLSQRLESDFISSSQLSVSLPFGFLEVRDSPEARIIPARYLPNIAHMDQAKIVCRNRRVCITSEGFFGLVPGISQVGDQIGIFVGAKAPYVLRRTGDPYVLVGDAYIQHMMKGEALKMEMFRPEMIDLQ